MTQENDEEGMTGDQKHKAWGYGDWVHEPNRFKFHHRGYNCIVARSINGGYLCGYVEILPTLPFYGKGLDCFRNIQCHGGINYCDKYEGEEGYYWIGFDCGHLGDYIPAYTKFESPYHSSGVYRDLEFSINECIKIAEQLDYIEKGYNVTDLEIAISNMSCKTEIRHRKVFNSFLREIASMIENLRDEIHCECCKFAELDKIYDKFDFIYFKED